MGGPSQPQKPREGERTNQNLATFRVQQRFPGIKKVWVKTNITSETRTEKLAGTPVTLDVMVTQTVAIKQIDGSQERKKIAGRGSGDDKRVYLSNSDVRRDRPKCDSGDLCGGHGSELYLKKKEDSGVVVQGGGGAKLRRSKTMLRQLG